MRALSCLLALTLFFPCLLGAGEQGGGMEWDPSGGTDRRRLARTIFRHDFENLRDPDSGYLLPESAALGGEGWPDFWEPVRAVGFPEYLIPTVRIVPDTTGAIAGAYRDAPNQVLRMDFDGTRVGIRTRTPVPINSGLAYEYSIMVRDTGLDGARIRTGVEWMRVDPSTVEVLRADDVAGLGTGQVDWPVVPHRMLVNDPPPDANAARFYIMVERVPGSVGGDYRGSVWVDDVTLRPLPKILVGAPREPSGGGDGRAIPVLYSGLFDNVPDPANPGFYRGRRYSRQVEITDVFGQPQGVGSTARVEIEVDEEGEALEEITFPRDRFGVYYFNIRLYDSENRLATDVMRAVAVMPPERQIDNLALHNYKPVFGVRTDIVPEGILASSGLLRRTIERSGAKMTKIVPWRDTYAGGSDNDSYYAALVNEVRPLRAAGLHVTGVVRPPSAMFDEPRMYPAVTGESSRLNAILLEAGRHLGLFVDSWQWGEDADTTFRDIPPGKELDSLLGSFRDFAAGLPTIASVPLGTEGVGLPGRIETKQGYFPEGTGATRIWPLAAPVFPWLYEPFYRERGLIYPPARLARLSPPPPVDMLEEQARLLARTGAWLSLELPGANVHEPNAASERVQLEEMLIRTVYAAVVAPEVVYLGSLFDPAHGMLRRDASGTNTLETMARPAYLAAATVSELLEGAEYLGEMWLLPPFEAHAFRRPGGNASVVVLWHNDTADELILSRKEIANGPILHLRDWAGNTVPLPASIPVRRTPSFITGLPAELLLTRMSIRINPDQQVKSINRRQNQTIDMVNHFARQTPIQVRLRYAARLNDLSMENSWTVRPEEMRLNLAPFSPLLTPGRMRYSVSPDANSQIGKASPVGLDKSGTKVAQAEVSVNTTPPADMTIYLPFRLQSDLDIDVEQLVRAGDPHFVTLQLKVRWFPPDSERRRTEIKVTPYYMKRGQMKESAAFPISVKAHPQELRGDPTASFESIELRIPRLPQTQTWVGLDEEGGSNFYLLDVTDYLLTD